MDNTLDSIRPSESNNPQVEMSYLYGRDPSILAYGQRPCPAKGTKKNLLSLYDVEECTSLEENTFINSDSQSFQTVKVYLRMKPFQKKLKITQEQQEAYKITSSTTLSTRLPVIDNDTSCLKRSHSSDIVCRKFTFTKTFGPETTQLELFEQAVKHQMVDFLAGQNSTIMTYGTTNSGKSYTLQGTTTSPGIIPRGLEFVFSNITPKSTPSYKPMHHCDVVSLDPLERAQELEIKTKLLTFASVDKHQYINAYKEMQKLLQKESPIRPSHCNAHYSIWVSFAEIYNETVYDLLSNECQKKRTPLKLATDNQGRAYIKGLKTVCVSSGSEAYQVLMAGQYNLKVAATALNARSSRSHCIFTIKLLKYYKENMPDSVEVSTFAFCDLAGSERLKKTLNIGDRLKEAQNINTSLLVLGRCLKSIHEGQLTKQKVEHVGPFRESKLTRLFQKALSGKEHIALIVNINPVPNLYIETQNVLNFSAIAKKIVIEQKERTRKKLKSRFSQIVIQSVKTVTDWDATELESEEWQNLDSKNGVSEFVQLEHYEDVISKNEKLKKEIVALKSSALTRDLEIRQEMADTYTAMMKELEADWKTRIKDVEEQQEDVLQWSVKQVEDFYKQKLDQLSSRKRRHSVIFGNDVEGDFKKVEELEIETSHLTSRVVLLKNNVKELKETNQTLNVEKNKLTFELSLLKEDLKGIKSLLDAAQQDVCPDEETKFYIEELKSQLFAKQEQVKKLKVFLNEAKEEYIAITTEMREKECLLTEQEEMLVENEDKIEDLEAQLEHGNICLTEKTKAIELLEEKLESQTKRITDTDIKMQDMQDRINKLESEKLMLQDEVKFLKKSGPTGSTIKDVECKIDDLEKSEDFLKYEVNLEVITKDGPCADFETNEKDKNEKEIENTDTLYPGMDKKIVAIEAENSVLKQRLAQNTNEIQNLERELECAKVKLKDISEQVCNLQTMRTKSKIEDNNEQSSHRTVGKLVEIGCQVDSQFEESQTNTNENDVDNKSSQTTVTETKEEINQTSFMEKNDESEVADEWAKLTVKYDDVKALYKEKCLRVDELVEEISSLKQRKKCLMEKSDTNRIVTEEYKKSIELLQNELLLMKEDKKQVEEVLQNSDCIKISLQKKITDYEHRVNETEKKLSSIKDDHVHCMEKLRTVQEDLKSHASKCLDIHVTKIAELEHSLHTVTDLQEQINALSENLKVCQAEKDHLQKLFDESSKKRLELEDRLEHAEDKEREKDAEITSLQKEMKHMIQRTESDERSDKLMEREMKNAIRDLTETKELLSQKQEHIEHLEMRLKSSEQNARALDLLQQSTQERQAEIERLRNINDELKSSLMEKEHEMEAFMRNGDEMVTKYETLVKSQQGELETRKRELTKRVTRRPDKDHCENTSEDEVVLKERRTRRTGRKRVSPVKQGKTVLIDLSGSDSKRSGRKERLTTLLPPNSEPISERRRNTRKKKLFVMADESFQDIEPLESIVTLTPSSQTRSLRSRRK